MEECACSLLTLHSLVLDGYIIYEDGPNSLNKSRDIYGHWNGFMFSHIPFNIEYDDESKYYQPNIDSSFNLNIGYHKYINFLVGYWQLYEDKERNCSISFDVCDHINITGLTVVGDNHPFFVDNETGTISFFGLHGIPKYRFNATVNDFSFKFHMVTDDVGSARGFNVIWDVLSDYIVAPPVLKPSKLFIICSSSYLLHSDRKAVSLSIKP